MNSRRLFGLALVALLLMVFPFTAAAQEDAPQRSTPAPNRAQLAKGVEQIDYPPRLDADLNEPNDDPLTATWISTNDFLPGLIDPAGDVDYFAFYGYMGDVIVADTDAAEADSPLDTTLTLYDQDGVTQLAYDDDGDADTDSRLSATLPAEGWYFLKVAAAGHPNEGGEEYAYWLFLSLADVYEPNNRISRSTLFAIGDEIMANISPDGDVDYYRFYGEAGQTLLFDIDASDIGSWLYPRLTLYGPDGFSQLARYGSENGDPLFSFTLPSDGPYYIKVEADYTGNGGSPQHFYVLRVDFPPLLISPSANGNVAGIAYAPGDILLYKQGGNEWEMYFDASDVGVKGNLAAFDTDGACLLMSFATKQTLNLSGVSITVWPQDIVRFCPTHTGEDTTGDFSWFFDGSDVGLSVAGEAIDAISYGGSGNALLLSTSGNFKLPGYEVDLTGRDEDLLRFYPDWLGSYTVGSWSLDLDGSTVPGLGSEDVTGLWAEMDDVRYLVVENNFNILGVQGDGNDIFTLSGYEWTGYSAAPFWRGEDVGFPGRIDGVDMPLTPYPIDPYPYP